MTAVTFEAETHHVGSGGTTQNFTSPVITDANYALVWLTYERNNANINSPTCTFDGVGLDRVSWHWKIDTHYWGVALWKIANPGSEKNIVTAWGVSGGYHVTGCITFKDVGLSDPLGAVAEAIGKSTTPAVTVASGVDELVCDCSCQNAGSYTQGAGQTKRIDHDYQATYLAVSTEAGADPTVAMTWTTDQNRAWAITGISLKPEAAGAVGGPVWIM